MLQQNPKVQLTLFGTIQTEKKHCDQIFFSAQRCQCLGDFANRNYSINSLDMYCRNDSWIVLPSAERDENQKQLDTVVPSKVRCGSEDPLEMNITTKCHCWPIAGEGSSTFTFF